MMEFKTIERKMIISQWIKEIPAMTKMSKEWAKNEQRMSKE